MSSPEETTASGRPKRRAAQPPPVGLDIEGRDAATGSCHCCGGMLSRTPESARQCGKCSARYHAYDCGNRRRDAGFTDFDQCPRVSVFPPSIPRVSTRPGPVFYTRIPKHSPSFLYRGLFFSRTIFPDSTDDSTLTDAFLRPDSAPRCACAREDRCSATPGPSATPAERSANTPSAHPPRSTLRMGPERRPKRTKEPPPRTAPRTIDGFPTSTIQCWPVDSMVFDDPTVGDDSAAGRGGNRSRREWLPAELRIENEALRAENEALRQRLAGGGGSSPSVPVSMPEPRRVDDMMSDGERKVTSPMQGAVEVFFPESEAPDGDREPTPVNCFNASQSMYIGDAWSAEIVQAYRERVAAQGGFDAGPLTETADKRKIFWRNVWFFTRMVVLFSFLTVVHRVAHRIRRSARR